MNVLIVYCHPSKKSYTYQILGKLENTLKNRNIKYQISDLYEMDFRSEMSEQEYMREGLLDFDLPIPPDVKREHQKIENADCIIFLYPVWWSDCPAKLKGWFDRVFCGGYAHSYDKNEKGIQKMKIVKYGISLCTAGYSNAYLEEIDIAQSMRKVMIDDRFGQRFDKKEMIILGGTLDLGEVRNKHFEIIKNIGDRLVPFGKIGN